MATAVLRPQDCTLQIPFITADAMSASQLMTRSKLASNRKSNSCPNSRRRRRNPSDEKICVRETTEEARKPEKELVMGKVRILKRGDNLSPSLSEGNNRIDRRRSVRFEKVEDAILCSTDRLGPYPDVVQEQISVCEKKKVVEDRFAGCVVTSPPPSSLPMPMNYWVKKEKCDATSMAMDLRRILRLDLV